MKKSENEQLSGALRGESPVEGVAEDRRHALHGGSRSEGETSPTKKDFNLKRSITIASLIMMASVLLSRVMGLVREQVLAHFFGTSVAMDAYVTAFLIPEVVNHLLAGGFLSISFIPIFQKYLVKNDRVTAWRVFSNLLTLGTLIMVVLIVIACVCCGPVVNMLTDDPQKRALTIAMTRIILPAQLFFYWGAFLMAVQYAQGRFFLPALLPLCYNGGIIVCGVLLLPWLGIKAFAWGVFAGALIGNVAVQVPGALRAGMHFTPHINLRDPEIKRYVFITLPLMLGLGMSFANEALFRIFGSLLGTGVTALLYYPLHTMMILVAIFGQASGVALYPFLSKMAAAGDIAGMNRATNAMLVKIGAVLLPCCALMMVLARPTLGLLFEHGSFTAASTIAAAPVLVMYLIGAYAFAANALIVRNFYACQNTLFPMLVSSFAVVGALPLYYLFGKLYGARGIALANSLFMIAQALVLYTSWSIKRGNMTGLKTVAGKLLVIIVAAVPGAVVCFAIQKYLPHYYSAALPIVNNVVTLAAAGIPAMALTVIILHLTRIMPLGEWVRVFRKK